jgi:hypothetical protein
MEHDFCLAFRVKVNSIVVTFNFYSVIIYVVIKEIENKKPLKIQGNIENIKGNYQAQIIGHGTELSLVV